VGRSDQGSFHDHAQILFGSSFGVAYLVVRVLVVDQEEVKEITSIRKLIALIYEDIPSGHADVGEIKEAKDLEDVVEKATSSGNHFHGLIEGMYEEINIYIDKIIRSKR
jgi:hypothetical protein